MVGRTIPRTCYVFSCVLRAACRLTTSLDDVTVTLHKGAFYDVSMGGTVYTTPSLVSGAVWAKYSSISVSGNPAPLPEKNQTKKKGAVFGHLITSYPNLASKLS